MSMETALFTALSSLVSSRVYPDVGPDGVTKPYITYQQVGGEAPTFLESAVPSKRNARMQVNVWATTRISANTIAVQVEAAMVAATTFQAKPLGSFVSEREPDTKLYGTRQDFTVWADR